MQTYPAAPERKSSARPRMPWRPALLASTLSSCCCALLLHCEAGAAAPQQMLPQGLQAFSAYGEAGAKADLALVPVTGQDFGNALRVSVPARGAAAQAGLAARPARAMHKGDTLWVSFKARRLSSKRETGEAFFELRIEHLVGGKPVWPPHLERGVSVGEAWTETSIPFVLEHDATPDELRVVLGLDSYQQQFEIGPVTLLDYGPGVALESLPRSTVHYDGDQADAAWRAEAAARIEQLRKGDLIIQVLRADGTPAAGAEVAVVMKRSAFNWGTAVTSAMLLAATPDGAQYRAKLAAYFNQVVFENEMKSKYWFRQPPEQRGAGVKQAAPWLREHGITVRGHVMVWPSWQHSPHLTPLKDDPAALRAAISDGIAQQGAAMRGQFAEWDVVNEPYLHHDFMDRLGRRRMADWFVEARKAAPGVKLFLNDYVMFHGQGPGSPSQVFYDNLRYLQQQGAPLDAIGEQAHIGGTPPGIPYVLERLDYFAKLGLPIQISEFDINSNDEDFKARYMADFMTALYSHPAAAGFVQWGFWAGAHWFPVAALWDKDWKLRKNGQVYVDLVGKTWRTDYHGQTDATGSAQVRGYCGDYEVAVTDQGKTVRRTYALDRQGGTLRIDL